MPETPTPGVNGHELSVPALHASMSTSSLAPAASTLGWLASTARAGSFCLFCENGPVGLPTVTRVSADPALAPIEPAISPARATMTGRIDILLIAFLLTWNKSWNHTDND